MAKPTVSIICVRRKNEERFSQTLESLWRQTFTNHEIIVAEQDGGSAFCLNQALSKCSGKYVAFTEAGQIWAADKLKKQMLVLAESSNLGWCYCGASVSAKGQGKRLSDKAALPAGYVLKPLFVKNFIPSGSVVIRRDVLSRVGAFNEAESYKTSEEWDMWLRIAAGYQIRLVAEPLVELVSADDWSHQRLSSMKTVVEAAFFRHREELTDLRSEALAEIHLAAGHAYLTADHRELARQCFEEALTHGPLRSDVYLSWLSSFLSSESQRQIRDLHNLSKHVEAAGSKKDSKPAGEVVSG